MLQQELPQLLEVSHLLAQAEHQEECLTLRWEELLQLESINLQLDIQVSLSLNQSQVEAIRVSVELHSLRLNSLVSPLLTLVCHKIQVMVSLKALWAIQILASKLLNKILVTHPLEQLNQIMAIQQLVIHLSLTTSL